MQHSLLDDCFSRFNNVIIPACDGRTAGQKMRWCLRACYGSNWEIFLFYRETLGKILHTSKYSLKSNKRACVCVLVLQVWKLWLSERSPLLTTTCSAWRCSQRRSTKQIHCGWTTEQTHRVFWYDWCGVWHTGWRVQR